MMFPSHISFRAPSPGLQGVPFLRVPNCKLFGIDLVGQIQDTFGASEALRDKFHNRLRLAWEAARQYRHRYLEANMVQGSPWFDRR